MAGSVSEQDEENPVGLSCLLGITGLVPAKAKFFGVIFWPYIKSFIDQACSAKMTGLNWPKKNLANNSYTVHYVSHVTHSDGEKCHTITYKSQNQIGEKVSSNIPCNAQVVQFKVEKSHVALDDNTKMENLR